MTPFELPTLSVAILTARRAAKLAAVLDAVLSQLAPSDELLVCITEPCEETTCVLAERQRHDATLRIVPYAGDFSFARARNALVAEARTEILAFLDDDCIPGPSWLELLRTSLSHCDVVGGPVLPANLRDVPRKWDEALLWAVGMTGRDAIANRPDSYPACANLAARTQWFRQIPFRETPDAVNSAPLYVHGREDAQWCLEARREGARFYMEPRAVVLHDIPGARYSPQEIENRTVLDATSAWLRDPTSARRAHAQRILENSLSFPWDQFLRWRGRRTEWSRRLWQQHAATTLARSADKSPHSHIPSGAKQLAQSFVAGGIHILRRAHQSAQPPLNMPRIVVVSAETFFGDNVLLRNPIEWLARSYLTTHVHVVTTYPWLFAGLSPNVRVQSTNAQLADLYASADTILVPYAHKLTSADTLKKFGQKLVTFDWDVGWPAKNLAYRAAHVVEKRPDVHEIWNLARLLGRWPLHGVLPMVSIPDNPAAAGEFRLRVQLPKAAPYFTVHTASALPSKHWPHERWVSLVSDLAQRIAATPIIIGAPEDSCDAQTLKDALQRNGTDALLGAGVLNGAQLTECLRGAVLAVGCCSGPKHLAMALNTPTFTLYGPSAPLRWGDVNRHLRHGHVISPLYGLSQLERGDAAENHEMLALSLEHVTAAFSEYADIMAEEFEQRCRSARS